MGNYASKLLSYTNESRKECNEHQTSVQQASMEDNSIYTPELSEKRVLGDPRSISTGIKRTPIEVNYTPIGISRNIPSAIPKYLQRKYLETNMDVVMPPLTPKKSLIPKLVDSDEQNLSEPAENYLTPNTNVAKSLKEITPIDKERFLILGLDPRSPAADFDRTPILLPRSLALIKARSQELLYRRGSYETDIYDSKNTCQKISTSLSIPEIRLSSDIISESVKSSLDTEKQDGTLSTSQYDSDLSISKNLSEKEITVIKNPKYSNEKEESLISDEQTVVIEKDKIDEIEKQDDCENIKSNMGVKDDDKIKLWHDSLSSEENVSGKEDWKELSQEEASREDVIITFDKNTMISISLKPIKTKEDFRKKGDIKGKKRNSKDVKCNEEKFFTPENKWGTEVHEHRTPLGNRSNNGQIQKKPQQLLKNIATPTKMQQENTPPRKTFNRKTRNGVQWDPNSTVLI